MSLAPAASEDIRDIRLPSAPVPAWLLIAVVAAGLLCVLAGYLVWRRRRLRNRPPAPFELALRQLEAARALLLASRAEEFCVAASGVVRRYIEAAYRAPATPRTTEEFLRTLANETDSPLARHGSLLGAFLQQCDLVKFGRVSPPPESLEPLYESACAFVRRSASGEHDTPSAA